MLAKQQDFINHGETTQIRLIAQKCNKCSKVFHFPKVYCDWNKIGNVCRYIKNNYRSQQDFQNKKDPKVTEIINKLEDEMLVERMRKCVPNSILYCHLYAGGVADGEIAEKVNQLKKLENDIVVLLICWCSENDLILFDVFWYLCLNECILWLLDGWE